MHIYHDDWFEYETIIEVYDKTLVDEETIDDYSEFRFYSWKEAKEEALELIKEKEHE